MTNKVVRIIGQAEHARFLHLALYQGAPKKKNIVTIVLDFYVGNGCLRESCLSGIRAD